MRAVMDFVFIDSQQDDSRPAPETERLVNSLFVPALEGEGLDLGQRLAGL